MINLFASLAVGSIALIPTALVYSIHEKKKAQEAKDAAWAIERAKLPECPIHARGCSVGPGRIDAKWINNAWVSNVEIARQEAVRAVEVASLKKERAEWDASFLGRCVNGTKNGFVGAVVLLILSPFILMFCLPILGICALIGFPTIGLFLLIAWCLSDFQNGVADRVVEKMKK